MVKSFVTIDGRRLKVHPKIPYGKIDAIVDAMHVSMPDGDVTEAVAQRARRNPGWTARLIGHAADYGIARHHSNRALYQRVMGGW